jgi:Rrf2 family protein
MRLSSNEEYGLRCMLAIEKAYREGRTLTIHEISEMESIPEHTIAKILRELRIGGFLKSERGHTGGYTLAKPPEKISLNKLLETLGGKLFDEHSCDKFHNDAEKCSKLRNCNVRALWLKIQFAIDNVLKGMTLADLASLKK